MSRPVASILIAALSLFTLAACGGGGDEMAVAMPDPPIIEEPDPDPQPQPDPQPGAGYTPETAPDYGRPGTGPDLPMQDTSRAQQAPVVKRMDGTYLHVGAPVFPSIIGLRDERLEWLETRDGVFVSYGTTHEGAAKNDVIAYLLAFESPTRPGVSTFADAPIIRLAEGTSAEFMDYAARAVQLINSALPSEARLQIGTAAPSQSDAVPDGQIFVGFIDGSWPSRFPSEHLGTTISDEHAAPKMSAHVWLNVERIRMAAEQMGAHVPEVTFERAMLDILAHELLHALGLDGGHVSFDQYPHSILNNSPIPTFFGTRENDDGDILYPIDREGLLAAYSSLSLGDSALELGAWGNEATHIRGEMVIEAPGSVVHFGAAHRNGLTQPWALGPIPTTNLNDNEALTGTATWDGHLLGFTPAVETVAGSARLNVDLVTLDGALAFTDLEWWAAGAAPGDVGTGQKWGDGSLAYRLDVRGNTFIQTGGDAGLVTGAFFGESHEAMGGTLERDDLTAAFGGKR